MKNRLYILHPATLFFLLSLLVVLLSWIGEIYNWSEVRNLLSAEGIRWWLRNVEPSLRTAPYLGSLIFLSAGCGVLIHSGWLKATLTWLKNRNSISRREKNAWLLSLLVCLAGILGWVILLWGPWNGVRSITGHFLHSPLWDGSLFLLASGWSLIGIVYGFAVDAYHGDKDIVNALSYGISAGANAFVSMFFIIQFFALLEYSKLPLCWHIPEYAIQILYLLSILLSFGFAVEKKHLSL